MARKNRTPEENERRAKIRELLQTSGISSMDDIQNLFKETIAEFMENGLEAELDDELGYSRYDYKNKDTDNSRNGHSSKTLRTSFGDVDVSVPRDRKGEFEPQVLKKNQTSVSQDIEEKIPRLLGDKELQLCAMQGQVFTMARDMEIPIYGFAEIFMSCPMGALFDGACDDQTCVDILRVLAPAPKDTVSAALTMKREYVESSGLLDVAEPCTAEYAYWLGFIYRYQQCRRCLPSSFILERFPPVFMRKAYEELEETESFILPDLVLITPHHNKYSEYCEQINTIYQQYTDRVERFSVDESWLDVTGSLHLYGSGQKIADELRKRIREEIGITISVGVSFNKVFAKLGSDYKKPDATTVISRENFRDIVWPLPAHDMLFVGKAAEEALDNGGIHTIGGIAQSTRERMTALLGKSGGEIWDHANGIDNSTVKRFDEVEPVKSVGNSITFARDLSGEHDIRTGLTMLCDSVGTRLRQQRLYCNTVQIQIKDPFLKTIQRQCKVNPATNSTKALLDVSMTLLQKSWSMTAPIRLLGVSASGLSASASEQMTLLDDVPMQRERNAKLDQTVDAIRQRYGKKAIAFGSTVKTDIVRSADESEKRLD